MTKKGLTPADLMNIFLYQMRQKEVIMRAGLRINKRELNELRKEAKKVGMKLSGEYGPDGKYHIYVSKGKFRRQVA